MYEHYFYFTFVGLVEDVGEEGLEQYGVISKPKQSQIFIIISFSNSCSSVIPHSIPEHHFFLASFG
jgi:hypothetical protein